MIINLIEKNCAKILLLLAISPGSSYTRQEIKNKLEMNNITLDVSLRKLISLKLVKEKNKLHSPNLENYIIQKILGEKQEMANLPLKIQVIISDFIDKATEFKLKNIILFGSYAKLIFSDKSDIDLAVILNNEENKAKIEKAIIALASKLSKKHKKEIQVHFFSEADLKHKEDPLIKDILRNGRVLV